MPRNDIFDFYAGRAAAISPVHIGTVMDAIVENLPRPDRTWLNLADWPSQRW